jgi:DNA-binding NarL/FixJ family response regulator
VKPGIATRVFLVDDHPLVRESLASLIAKQGDLAVCGEAATASAALAAIGAARPDVAIVDLSLDGRSGLELIKDLKALHPQVAVLVLSMHDEELYAERALRAGARGYIMKREATRNVILAIRRVQQGEIYLSPRAAAALAQKLVTGPPAAATEPPVSRLSDRELEVFRQLGAGQATRQIAASMNVSAKTVQAYCARIKEKLGLVSSTQLLREAIRWQEEQGDN